MVDYYPNGISPCNIENEADIPNEITPLHVENCRGAKSKLSPECELWLTSLRYAINEYISNPAGEIRDQARNWFHSSRTSFGSFIFVCETLGFDPDTLRNGIENLSEKIGRPHVNCAPRRGSLVTIDEPKPPRRRDKFRSLNV